VIDAAGAIYVIGGYSSSDTIHNDVWVSTDGGADRTRRGSRDTRGYYRDAKGFYRGNRRGTRGVQTGY
jgi:hypothetical protein